MLVIMLMSQTNSLAITLTAMATATDKQEMKKRRFFNTPLLRGPAGPFSRSFNDGEIGMLGSAAFLIELLIAGNILSGRTKNKGAHPVLFGGKGNKLSCSKKANN
jgi:hypothetical protein